MNGSQGWAVYMRDGQVWNVVKVFLDKERAEAWVISRRRKWGYSVEPVEVII